MLIVALHKPLVDHFEMVKAEMQVMGAPRIKVYTDGEIYYALEGSHRVAVAHVLGIVPELEILEWDSVMTHDIDVDGLTQYTEATVEEIFEATYGRNLSRRPVYHFDLE